MIRQTGGIVGPVLSIFMFVYMGDTWDVWRCRNVMVSGLAVCFIAVCVLFQVQGSESDTDADVGSGAGAQSYEMVALTEANDAEENGEEKNNQKDLTWVEDGQNGDRGAGEVAVKHALSPTSPISPSPGELEQRQRQRNSQMAEVRCLCQCMSMDVSYVAAMIALSDIITGLASGMTIKFFPIFFIDVVGMHPVELSVLFMLSPVACSLCLWVNQNYTRKWLGRIWTPVLLKAVGISCLLWICVLATYHPDQKLAIMVLYTVRTGLMNSTKPLTKSIINDIVPKDQRGRWNALETVNAATWSGSAAVGGLLVDTYGYVPNFTATALLQLSASIPLVMIAHLVLAEGVQGHGAAPGAGAGAGAGAGGMKDERVLHWKRRDKSDRI
jgi:hypothetical protein